MDAELEQKLVELRGAFAGSLRGRLAEIDALWNDVVRAKNMPDSLQALQQCVHNLAGSGATFGFSALSESASAVELALESLGEKGNPRGEDWHNRIGLLLLALQQAARAPDRNDR